MDDILNLEEIEDFSIFDLDDLIFDFKTIQSDSPIMTLVINNKNVIIVNEIINDELFSNFSKLTNSFSDDMYVKSVELLKNLEFDILIFLFDINDVKSILVYSKNKDIENNHYRILTQILKPSLDRKTLLLLDNNKMSETMISDITKGLNSVFNELNYYVKSIKELEYKPVIKIQLLTNIFNFYFANCEEHENMLIFPQPYLH